MPDEPHRHPAFKVSKSTSSTRMLAAIPMHIKNGYLVYIKDNHLMLPLLI
jgi:hypothetical protein